MVLNTNELTANFNLTREDIEDMRATSKLYTTLHAKRVSISSSLSKKVDESVKEAEKYHYETMAYRRSLFDKNWSLAFAFLYKWNGNIPYQAPPGFDEKSKSYIDSKKDLARIRGERNKDIICKEKLKRVEAKEAQQLLILGEEQTFYNLLAVEQNASQKQIKRSFLKMARKYHPDKNDAMNAEEIFKRLNEAHEVLSCQVQRARYDEKLRQRSSEVSSH